MRCGRWFAVVPLLAGGGAWSQAMLLPTVTLAPTSATSVVAMPDASVGGALRSLASRAGVVFVGQVQTITRRGGVVEVVFGVDQVMLGDVGATYTLREWAGLWVAGEQRYRVGQRAMVFLHSANAAGLSSAVDGMEGVVPLVPMGADAAPVLDVRRLAARVQRVQGSAMRGEAIALPDAAKVVSAWKTETMEPRAMRLPGGMPVQTPNSGGNDAVR